MWFFGANSETLPHILASGTTQDDLRRSSQEALVSTLEHRYVNQGLKKEKNAGQLSRRVIHECFWMMATKMGRCRLTNAQSAVSHSTYFPGGSKGARRCGSSANPAAVHLTGIFPVKEGLQG
ncbi:uncharacterized protein N7500_010215 [Penicillium coprophilum]|uniref:uncharacterized protein n=1 Tax=Penicillium coprophilum TaxID=36646 RepID=UPI0023879ED8|nr:uncharacterized protein N7500_010215 [Penicillium coprophilum]KAJ5154776.1 hypothetical protein N7500_010215 [Penicillium coprophilum]